MKRYLTKIIVQPVWIEIDDDDNAAELISQPQAVAPKQLQEYTDGLLLLADQAKRGALGETREQS